MVALIILAAVAAIVVAVSSAQRRTAPGGRAPAPAGTASRAADDRLGRAVEAGIITAEQAAAVLALEPSAGGPSPVRARAGTATSPGTEILGYLGAVLAMAGVITLVAQFWDDLTTASRLLLLGGASAGFLVAGLFVREGGDDAVLRLRGFLLLLSTGALAGFAGLLGADALDWAPESVTRLVGAGVAVQSGALWARRDTRPAQHLTTYGGLVAVVAATVADVGEPALVGVALWTLGAAWLVAGWRGLLPPPLLPEVLGSFTALVSCTILADWWEGAAPLAGLATAVALLAAGVRGDRSVITGAGVLGILVFLPSAIVYFFGDTVGVPVAFLLVGGLLLVLALRHLRPGGGWPHDRTVHA
jgi:hypothetical protein